jgi:hypothetical protein
MISRILVVLSIVFIILIIVYFLPSSCTPDCKDKKKGDDDSCGGTCQSCTPDCKGKECGDDGCDGTCPVVCKSDTICQKETNQCIAIDVPIETQPSNSMQIINKTTEPYLHLFFQLTSPSDKLIKISGTGTIYESVDWNNNAWDPLGAKIVSEIIIPKNEYIIFTLPDRIGPPAFVLMALKMKNGSDSNPLTLADAKNRSGSTLKKLFTQSPILIEAGKEMVADSSAVDGINFKIKSELTTKDGVKTMEIKKNPCEGLDSKYLLDVGCFSPVKKQCTSPTCDCCTQKMVDDKNRDGCLSADQVCRFNDCSTKLFNIPEELLQKYYKKWDSGNPNPPVKGFINQVDNLIDGTDQKKYCDDIQWETGDFTTYCYDYNDTSSSLTLTDPYKMKLTYSDL